MIYPEAFEFIQSDGKVNSDPFVGIRVKNGKSEFWLPRGFETFPTKNHLHLKELFFDLYKTFKKFEEDRKYNLDYDRDRSKEKSKTDNVSRTEDYAYSFTDSNGDPVILYSKIKLFDQILNAYDILDVAALVDRVGRTESIDYANIDKYLHKAIYLPNDVIYIEEMELPKQYIEYTNIDLVNMYCFIYVEIQNELGQIEEVIDIVKVLASKFIEEHLGETASIFNIETSDTTLLRLKEILDKISKQTYYRDDAFWTLFDAVENFLYGELIQNDEGISWGITNFWPVWEDLCQNYVFRKFKDIVFAHTNVIVNGKNVSNRTKANQKVFIKDEFKDPFYIIFQDLKRNLLPDLVRYVDRTRKNFPTIDEEMDRYWAITESVGTYSTKNLEITLLDKGASGLYKQIYEDYKSKRKAGRKKLNSYILTTLTDQDITDIKARIYRNTKNSLAKFIEKETINTAKNNHILISDFKYHPRADVTSKSDSKISDDITKQLVYEYCLQSLHGNSWKIVSQFVIPRYYPPEYDFEDRSSRIGSEIPEFELSPRLRENNIVVFEANFKVLVDEFNTESTRILL